MAGVFSCQYIKESRGARDGRKTQGRIEKKKKKMGKGRKTQGRA